MSGSIQMENVYATENEAGVWQWLFGKTITSIVLHNTGTTDGFVGIAAPYLVRILPVCSHLSYFPCLVGYIMLDGQFFCLYVPILNRYDMDMVHLMVLQGRVVFAPLPNTCI